MSFMRLIVSLLGGIALTVMVVATLLAVVARYFGVSGFEWSYEVAGIAFIWVSFLGVILAEMRRENAAFAVLHDSAPAPLQRCLNLLASLVLGTFGAVLLASSVKMLQRSAFVPTPLLRWPGIVSSGAAPVLGAAILLIAVVRLCHLGRAA